MANRSAENTSQGYVLCCGCRYFHEWLRSTFAHARSAIWLFRCAVVSLRYIVCLLKDIQTRNMKFAKSYSRFYALSFKNNSCNIKWLYRKKIWKSLWCSLLNPYYVREEINRLLYLKEGLWHLAIKCKFITQNKIPWGCNCAIYKVSSIGVICRLNWLFHPWGGHWNFRYFFKISFCAKEFRFFGLRVHCSLRIFRSLAFGFRFSSKILV